MQATRSNLTGAHGGSAVPYLDHFLGTARRRIIADVLQSEQGAWFLHKRNRNMVVEVGDDVPAIDGFRWLPLGLLHQLLTVDDLVNMDTRTVLSCLPFTSSGRSADFEDPDNDFVASVLRSCDEDLGSIHSTRDILSWIADVRTRSEVRTERLPLAELSAWVCTDERISHRTGCFFDVIGVDVEARGREVSRWSQPMLAARGSGLVALLVARVQGVLHALVQLRSEPGLGNMPELAPTVQCTPATYERLPDVTRPRFLDEVGAAPADRIVFDHVLSDEGGRFYLTRSRHLIVEVPEADPGVEGRALRWMAYHQLAALLHHSDYVNVQARSLVACLRSLVVPWAR